MDETVVLLDERLYNGLFRAANKVELPVSQLVSTLIENFLIERKLLRARSEHQAEREAKIRMVLWDPSDRQNRKKKTAAKLKGKAAKQPAATKDGDEPLLI